MVGPEKTVVIYISFEKENKTSLKWIVRVDSVVPKTECAWFETYEYVADRLRAVRQDMVIQRMTGQQAVSLLEPMVRFLVYARYRWEISTPSNETGHCTVLPLLELQRIKKNDIRYDTTLLIWVFIDNYIEINSGKITTCEHTLLAEMY